MSMIYLGKEPDTNYSLQSVYFDTDDLDQEGYHEFCKHRDNLRKYYNGQDIPGFKEKAQMIGIDVDSLINDARKFIYETMIWGSEQPKQLLAQALNNIANDVEE